MSIVASAVIRPSRTLRAALASYGATCALAALALAHSARFHGAPLLALACGAVALCLWCSALETGNARRIDISGPGEIRLSVQQSLGAATTSGEALQLLPGSTLWPSLLILLLREATSGAVTVVVILPDSVAAGQFRTIAVSVTSIARRDNKFSGKNKIL